MGAPVVGKTYTFAVLAKSMKDPVTIGLEIERPANPYDRAAKLPGAPVTSEGWKELHVTFKAEKPFAEGWYAYVSCLQSNVEFRLDNFRLYEGDYVPANLPAPSPAAAKSAETAPMSAAAAATKPAETASKPAADPVVRLFDTGGASAAPLAGEAVAKPTGWKLVPEDTTDHAFAGDTVLVNNRLAVIFRRGGPGAEVYSRGQEGFTLRTVLTPTGDAFEMKLASLKIADNSPAEVVVDATFKSAGGAPATVRYALAAGQFFVKTEVRSGTKALAVAAPSRFVVMPDFFADDIVVDATQIPIDNAELPSENFLIHLLPDSNAIVMTVADSREQDARIALAGKDAGRLINRSDVYYGGGKVWVAVLEAPGIWHHRDISKSDAGKIIPLEWTAPFAAQWRVDWQGTDKLASSWEMIIELSGNRFQRPAMWGDASGIVPGSREVWATVLGTYKYPCWLDLAKRGHFQPLARGTRFDGPAVVYPINRLKTTPLDQFTVVDVVKNTLGVGPCQYVLDVEGQGATRKGVATCATRDELQAIYKANQQKQSRAKIETSLNQVVIFVKHIRSRIEEYSAWGHDMLKYLDEQKKAHPELTPFLDEMAAITNGIDAGIAKRREKIKTPQYVVDLTEDFRKNLLDKEGPDAVKECVRITEAIVEVGGNQDELVGESRVHVKILRQRAAMAMATNPAAAEVAKEIRDRTQKILRNALSYEHPRH